MTSTSTWCGVCGALLQLMSSRAVVHPKISIQSPNSGLGRVSVGVPGGLHGACQMPFDICYVPCTCTSDRATIASPGGWARGPTQSAMCVLCACTLGFAFYASPLDADAGRCDAVRVHSSSQVYATFCRLHRVHSIAFGVYTNQLYERGE